MNALSPDLSGGEPDGGRLMDADVVAAARVRRLDGAVSERYVD